MLKRPKKPFFLLVFAITILLVICLTSCGLFQRENVKKYTKSAFLLDTYVSVSVYKEDQLPAVDMCLEKIREYEKVFSRTDPESELYRLNSLVSMEVSDELFQLISSSLHFCELTNGRLDISMGAVSAMYGFSSDSPTLPPASDIASALEHSGWKKIKLDGKCITLSDPEAQIDLGAVAKGYIADRLAELLTDSGVESAVIDLGGNILCLGSKPDGSDFSVGIQYPYKDTSTVITQVSLSDMSVVTSGVYQRFFEKDGKTYHHILDPDTGYPVDNSLLSVSIISKKSADCDALSTAVFALGLEDGMELVDSLDGVWAIFVDESFKVFYSDGFEEMFLS